MYITSAGSGSRLLIAITGIDMTIFWEKINEKQYKWSISTDPNKTP